VKFRTTILQGDKTATGIRVPDEVMSALNAGKKPKVSLVKLQGNELKISKQVHFETNSAKILGDSNSLMEEIADVLQRTPTIKKVEILSAVRERVGVFDLAHSQTNSHKSRRPPVKLFIGRINSRVRVSQ